MGLLSKFIESRGPGLIEGIYKKCFGWECELRQIPYVRELQAKLVYEGHDFEEPLRLDFLIDDVLILEFKGTVNGFKASGVTMEPPSSATQAFMLTFKKGVFTNGASISFTIGQNEIGTF